MDCLKINDILHFYMHIYIKIYINTYRILQNRAENILQIIYFKVEILWKITCFLGRSSENQIVRFI